MLSPTWIKSGVDYLKFEDVLQYVAVPQIRVEPQPVAARRGPKRPSKPDGKGRNDLVFLFKWLKGDRNVKTILKVIVDDLQEPSHSDEAIEAALENVGVEIWDWKKTDLCSEVIYNVAPTARIVNLYWSGNNSVLRGWSEAEGLARLEKLEKVYVYGQLVSLNHPGSNFPLCLLNIGPLISNIRASNPQNAPINTSKLSATV